MAEGKAEFRSIGVSQTERRASLHTNPKLLAHSRGIVLIICDLFRYRDSVYCR